MSTMHINNIWLFQTPGNSTLKLHIYLYISKYAYQSNNTCTYRKYIAKKSRQTDKVYTAFLLLLRIYVIYIRQFSIDDCLAGDVHHTYVPVL